MEGATDQSPPGYPPPGPPHEGGGGPPPSANEQPPPGMGGSPPGGYHGPPGPGQPGPGPPGPQGPSGYPPPGQGSYPPPNGQGSYPPPQGQGSYPPPQPQGQGSYPPPQGQGSYPPPQGQGSYPPPQGQGSYPPPQGQGSYPPPQGQGSYPPPQGQGQGSYPPPQGQGSYPPPQGQGSYPPPQGQGSYPPPQSQGSYPPPQGRGGYPPHGQGQYPPPQGYGPPQGYPPSGPGPGGYPPPPAQHGPGAYSYHDGAAPGQGTAAWQPGQGEAFKWDNLPTKPLDDDPNRGPPRYQPPPLPAGMQNFPGYEGVGGFGQYVPLPAPPPLPVPQGEPPKMEFDKVANLTEDQCREAMLNMVAENCCYGKGCAEEHKIFKIDPSTALHYSIETYTESRSTGYKYEPYRGGPVDGPENGQPPLPWQLQCAPEKLFLDHVKLIEVPHTATVKMCDCCDGRGFNRCWRCHGLGRVRCSHCHGDGRVRRHDPERGSYESACTFCGGDGWRRCMTCHGDGRVKCSECHGFRQIKCFIELSVTFANHLSEYILEKTDMPDELVKTVEGTTVFEQTLPQVWPIIAYPVLEVNVNSQRLVEEHRVGFPNERQIQQRQVLRAVPVTEVDYKWKDTDSRYWVYGRERRCYSPDYPQSCCWGCQIL